MATKRTISIQVPVADIPTCSTCTHFKRDKSDDVFGFCRRYPPIVYVLVDAETDCAFPTMEQGELCGEFLRRTN